MRLHLASARRIWRQLVERAEKEEWSYRDFLALLVTEEIAQRQQTRLTRLSRWASFPFLKTIDDFDFTCWAPGCLPTSSPKGASAASAP